MSNNQHYWEMICAKKAIQGKKSYKNPTKEMGIPPSIEGCLVGRDSGIECNVAL